MTTCAVDPEQFFAASRLVIVAGKGGVGKTVVSATLARAAARVGLSTLVIEVEGKSGLPTMYGQQELDYEEVTLSAGGGRIQEEQVGLPHPLQLLDLAQDEDVLDARRGGGHHVQGAGRHESTGDARQAVVAEVVEQGVVGRERAGPHLAVPVRPPTRVEDGLVVVEGPLAVHGGQTRLPLDLDHQRGQADACGGPGQRGRDHGFAHTALPGNDDQPRCSEEARGIQEPPS